jgi:hypothetical protein
MPYTIKLHICFSQNEFLGVCSVDFCCLASSSNSFVGHQFGPVRCKLVLPYDNLLPWQFIESMLLLYTSASCWCILAADIFCVHKKSITPRTSKQDRFSKWVMLLNCHSCAPSVHMSHEPYSPLLYQQHLKFNQSSVSNYETCKFFWSTLILSSYVNLWMPW